LFGQRFTGQLVPDPHVEHKHDMHARLVWLPLAAVIALGCSSAEEIPRVDTEPTECRNSAGQTIDCDIALEEDGGFTITLISRSCEAFNNEILLDQPTVPNPVLTTNGCNEPIGTQWDFGTTTPFAAGTAINLVIVADEYANPPGLRVTDIPPSDGSLKSWRLQFEDGADQDFDDIVLELRQVPAT
jgi:hypothetical protein